MMDNYFTSVEFFEELLQNGSYTTTIVCTNHVENPKSFGMACMMWKDKRLTVLLSTHAMPIDFLYEP